MITDARQRLPARATMYAHGAATPAFAATKLVASELPRASESSASDCAKASPSPRMPCFSSCSPRRMRFLLVGQQREDPDGCAVRLLHLERRDDDRRTLGELAEVGHVLEDHAPGCEPDAVQLERRRVHR